jgi:CBS domain-containing protein
MRVEALLRSKGSAVETISPSSRVSTAATRIATSRIGCLVVSEDDLHVLGLITERDIVRALAHYGGAASGLLVRDVMSTAVPTCSPQDPISDLMRTMTNLRYRHVPVVENGAIVGIISIGDVVKQRLDDLELETHVLRDAYRAVH